MIDKSLPYSEEAERGIFGAIYNSPSESISTCEESGISSIFFYHPAHRILFETMQEMHAKGIPIDLITLTGQLQERRQLSGVGGPGYLAELQQPLSNLFLKSYIEICKDRYHKRAMIKASMELQGASYGDSEEIAGAVVRIERAILDWRGNEIASDEGLTNSGWLEVLDTLETRTSLYHKGKIEGISWGDGLHTLDRLTGGLQKDLLYVIGAPPNVGKSLLASQVVDSAVLQGIKVAVFTPEMKPAKYRERLMIQRKAMTSGECKSGFISETSLHKLHPALGQFRDHVFIDGTESISVAEMASKLRICVAKHPDIGLLVIDYLHLLKPAPESRGRGREGEVNQLIRGVDAMKKTFHLPILLIGSMNRESSQSKETRPRMAQFRDTGQIEYQADVVILLHFPDSDEATKTGTIIIDKHRDGEVRDIQATFDKRYLRFSER